MDSDQILRQHLLKLLSARQAHLMFDDAVNDFPEDKINAYPPNVPYTPWHLLEHIRRAQWDILDYIRNADYEGMNWPDDYWPPQDEQADMAAWQQTIDKFHEDLNALEDIVRDPKTDLMAPIPHGQNGHTILREVLLVADHNAYHIGELGILRQVLDAWTK
ncbi:DinB family protein [Phototrophicus methaneseepsis]|uniref:DinB family protein n=1 Tax=Phototrophicus methaneseepsis TaxID=2710758 RepID=A0A7S8IFB6_9CHLR|nr:DinB family protein [Phototrophicus methaneseepsis]QPC84570.1 DinB family protein [Phototrophicus methaneseepsis]